VIARLLVAFLLIAADEASGASDSSSQPPCASSRQEFRHTGELPIAVLRMIEQITTMADTNEPFQATDAYIKKGLPIYRFKSARQAGCKLYVHYERGGFAAAPENSIRFIQAGDSWVVDDADYPFSRLKAGPSRP
jgi:hypothetical protein